jgi:hypothetical protein
MTIQRVLLGVITAILFVYVVAAMRYHIQERSSVANPATAQAETSSVAANAQDETAADPETVRQYISLYNEYESQGRALASHLTATGSKEREQAQVNEKFAWRLLGLEYEAMNPAERAEVQYLHSKLPDKPLLEWGPDYLSTSPLVKEWGEDALNSRYEESLRARGFKLPE